MDSVKKITRLKQENLKELKTLSENYKEQKHFFLHQLPGFSLSYHHFIKEFCNISKECNTRERGKEDMRRYEELEGFLDSEEVLTLKYLEEKFGD